MKTLARNISHPTVARLPQERQPVACVSIHTLGPTATAFSGASGHLIAVKGRGWATSGAGHSTARADWNGTSAPPLQNAKSGEGCNPSPPDFRQSSRSLCVIKSAPDKRLSLLSVALSDTPQASTAFRVRLPVVLNGPANQHQRCNEIGVGGFHLVLNPSVPVIQQ